MAEASYGSVPFEQQLAFFRRKLNMPTTHWTDIYNSEHDWAFMVAGVTRDTMLADFRTSIEKVIADGGTIEQFRKDFDRIVAENGWDYNGGREWRSRIIYETNLFSSYGGGRYDQLQSQKEALPYWRYKHSDVSENPRHEHQAWDNLILSADDPWWKTHYAPNGWGCNCYTEGVSEEELKALGKSGPDKAPEVKMVKREIGKLHPDGPRIVEVPEGIDPGFEHAPGRSRLDSAVPPELPDPPISGSSGSYGLPNTRPKDPLPAPRAVPADLLLSKGLPDKAYAEAFLKPFGATLEQSSIFKDVLGDSLVMGRALFTDRKTGAIKANKRERGQYMGLMAKGLMEPDEIWVRMEYQAAQQKTVVRRRYIAQFVVPGQKVPALAVFEWSTDGWSGITTFNPETDLNDLRIGVRVYRRED